MSRVGDQPIKLPEKVSIQLEDSEITVKGPKGELKVPKSGSLRIEQKNDFVLVKRKDDTKTSRSMHGLTRALLYNAVRGTVVGFSKQLEMVGVGYRARMEGKKLTLSIGYSHPVTIEPPEGIEFSIEDNTLITVSGIDEQQVGQVAAEIRRIRPPEPYKGKGIRYKDEVVHKKPGKAAKAIGIGE